MLSGSRNETFVRVNHSPERSRSPQDFLRSDAVLREIPDSQGRSARVEGRSAQTERVACQHLAWRLGRPPVHTPRRLSVFASWTERIRARILAAAIIEHEVYKQASGSEWEAGLDSPLAPWRSHPGALFPVLTAWVHVRWRGAGAGITTLRLNFASAFRERAGKKRHNKRQDR